MLSIDLVIGGREYRFEAIRVARGSLRNAFRLIGFEEAVPTNHRVSVSDKVYRYNTPSVTSANYPECVCQRL